MVVVVPLSGQFEPSLCDAQRIPQVVADETGELLEALGLPVELLDPALAVGDVLEPRAGGDDLAVVVREYAGVPLTGDQRAVRADGLGVAVAPSLVACERGLDAFETLAAVPAGERRPRAADEFRLVVAEDLLGGGVRGDDRERLVELEHPERRLLDVPREPCPALLERDPGPVALCQPLDTGAERGVLRSVLGDVPRDPRRQRVACGHLALRPGEQDEREVVSPVTRGLVELDAARLDRLVGDDHTVERPPVEAVERLSRRQRGRGLDPVAPALQRPCGRRRRERVVDHQHPDSRWTSGAAVGRRPPPPLVVRRSGHR